MLLGGLLRVDFLSDVEYTNSEDIAELYDRADDEMPFEDEEECNYSPGHHGNLIASYTRIKPDADV